MSTTLLDAYAYTYTQSTKNPHQKTKINTISADYNNSN